jgi:NhaP-type Na+/H+ or K+/H+ antiporter
MGAMGLASVVVGVLAGGVAKRWPATAYTDPEKESLAVVLAPLLMKWGLNAAWLARWREEATALGVLAQLGLIGYQRVQAAAPPPAPKSDEPLAKP